LIELQLKLQRVEANFNVMQCLSNRFFETVHWSCRYNNWESLQRCNVYEMILKILYNVKSGVVVAKRVSCVAPTLFISRFHVFCILYAVTERGRGLSPKNVAYSLTVKHTGLKSGGELCEILKV